LNNAGAALMPQPVYNFVSAHLQLELESGGYEAAAAASPAIEDFYSAIASLLNAQPEEIAYVENATRAWDMAFYAIPFRRGERIITHRSEYASNYLALLQIAKTKGVEIDLAPSNEWGQVDVKGLENLITPQTRLIAITHVPSTFGVINPVAEIGQIAKQHRLLYLLDACQSVGQMPVDVKAIGCDVLAATGRKFLRGPRGTGFLYVKQKVIESLHPPFIDLQAATWPTTHNYRLRPDARRFENWERFIAGQIGLSVAAKYAAAIGLNQIRDRIIGLIQYLNQRLSQLDGVCVQEPVEKKVQVCSGIVTLSTQNHSVESLQQALRNQDIHVSAVLERNAKLFLESGNIAGLLRVSPHYYNTKEEIDQFCDSLSHLL